LAAATRVWCSKRLNGRIANALQALLVFLPLLVAGCLTPFTQRLDEANAKAAAINQQLIIATSKLDEATIVLRRSEQKLDEANKTFYRMEDKINDMDKKFGTLEVGFRKMFGLKGDGKEEE
jgi:hypothetical protein